MPNNEEKSTPVSSPPTEERITLRPATPEDREFLLSVYASSREIELSIVPWDDDQKRAFVIHQFDAQSASYLDRYPAATHDIILFDAEPAGRLYAFRGPDRISIMDIVVLNEYRRRGIATMLVKQMQHEAAAGGKCVGVYVENYNPSQKFFADLGFSLADDDGVNLSFEWRTDAA